MNSKRLNATKSILTEVFNILFFALLALIVSFQCGAHILTSNDIDDIKISRMRLANKQKRLKDAMKC